MAEDEKAGKADSSAAEASPAVSVESLTDAERAQWLQSGKMPEAKKAAEEEKPSSPKAGASETPPAEKQEKEAAKEEPGKEEPQPESEKTSETDTEKKPDETPKRKGAEARKAELAADIQEHLRRRVELRNEVEALEKKKAELAASPTATKEPPSKPKPKAEDFETTEAFFEALADWKTEAGIGAALQKEREERTRTEQKQKLDELNNKLQAGWRKKLEAAMKVHADFEPVTTSKELIERIPPGSVLDAAILHRPEGAEILYYFGKHPEELENVLALEAPLDQVFALAAIEQKIAQGRVPPRRVTEAPPPASETSGKATVEEDPVGEAIRKGDVSNYMRLMNQQEARPQKTQ